MQINDEKIAELSLGQNLISPFCEELLNPHSYDVTLGARFKKAITYDLYGRGWEDYNGSVIIKPYEFWLGDTLEFFKIPRGLVGFVQGKSTIGRNGLQIECAGLIDAGFSGTITLEFFNMAPWPIRLTPGMRIGQIHFSEAEEPKLKFYEEIGSYNGQTGPKEPKYLI